MRPAPLPPGLGPHFAVRTARSGGVTPDRLRAQDLRIPHRGTRSTAPPARDLLLRAAELAPLLVDGRRLSHLTAAALHGMRLPEGTRQLPLHVTHRDAARGMRRPGIVGHRSHLPARVVTGADDVPLSHPIDAWVECGALLGMQDLVVMGDGLVCRRNPTATVDELRAAVRGAQGRRGVARLRAAMEQIRPGTDSPRETTLRLQLIRWGLPEPAVNAPLTDGRGRVIAHGDLVWPELGLVLEYEGRQHAESAEQFAIDIRRLNRIAEAGYRVIRIDAALLRDRASLLRQLRTARTLAEESRRGRS
jgi:hypothetical protein